MDFSAPFGQEVLRVGNLTDSLNRTHQSATNLNDERYKDLLLAIVDQAKMMIKMLPVEELPIIGIDEEKKPVIVRNTDGDPFIAENRKEEKYLSEKLKEKIEENKNKEIKK